MMHPQDGQATVGAFGMRLFRPFHLGLAAAAQLRCDQPGNASRNLDEAFACAERSCHRFGLPELHRLRAELIMRTSCDGAARDRAIKDLRTAAELANETGAVNWKQRAKAVLANYLQ